MGKKLKEKHLGGTGLILHKYFNGMEVIEATRELRIQPNEEDINGAVPNDPSRCIFSRTCQRQWASKCVLFFGTVAYVDLLDEKGVRHVERFLLSSAAKRFIRDFDAGAPMPPSGFVLKRPSPGQTAAAGNDRHKRSQRAALLKGRAEIVSKIVDGGEAPKQKTTARRVFEPKHQKTVSVRLSALRNGSGMVHFPAADTRAA